LPLRLRRVRGLDAPCDLLAALALDRGNGDRLTHETDRVLKDVREHFVSIALRVMFMV